MGKKFKLWNAKEQRYDELEENSVKCPLCGEYTFSEDDDDTMCSNCGWINHGTALAFPDSRFALHMSFNEAKKAFAEGRPIE